jgi:hypothetical protein
MMSGGIMSPQDLNIFSQNFKTLLIEDGTSPHIDNILRTVFREEVR